MKPLARQRSVCTISRLPGAGKFGPSAPFSGTVIRYARAGSTASARAG